MNCICVFILHFYKFFYRCLTKAFSINKQDKPPTVTNLLFDKDANDSDDTLSLMNSPLSYLSSSVSALHNLIPCITLPDQILLLLKA